MTGGVEATLRQDGKEALRVPAAFSDLRRPAGRPVVLATRPALPPPEDLMGGRVIPELTIGQRVEYRVDGLGAGPAERPPEPGVLDAVPGRT